MAAFNRFAQGAASAMSSPLSGGGMQTGLMKQAQSMQTASMQSSVSGFNSAIGGLEQQYGIQTGRAAPGAQMAQPTQPQGSTMGSGSLNNMAQQLARSYGLPMGSSGQMVDPYGNITYQPQSEEEMVKLQMISDAIYNKQIQDSHAKGVAAQQAGMGLVRDRGRGSLALMQSGMYENLANMYANQEFQQADYTLMIQQSQLRRREALEERARREAKKSRKWGAIGSLVGGIAGFAIGGPMGASIGAGVGGQAGSELF